MNRREEALKTIAALDRREEGLKAIMALNRLIVAGERHENVIQADFLVNTWFDATFGEEARDG